MNHKQVYMKGFDLYPDAIVLCEVCGKVAVDIHHILFKSQLGTDEIENLIALCRDCHDIAHGKVKNETLTRGDLYLITNAR